MAFRRCRGRFFEGQFEAGERWQFAILMNCFYMIYCLYRRHLESVPCMKSAQINNTCIVDFSEIK